MPAAERERHRPPGLRARARRRPRRAPRREPGEMSTERETMPSIAPTATMASAAFCSISATRFGSVAKRGLTTAKQDAPRASRRDGVASERAAPAAARSASTIRLARAASPRSLRRWTSRPADHRGEQQEARHGGLPCAGHAADGHVVEDHHQDQRADHRLPDPDAPGRQAAGAERHDGDGEEFQPHPDRRADDAGARRDEHAGDARQRAAADIGGRPERAAPRSPQSRAASALSPAACSRRPNGVRRRTTSQQRPRAPPPTRASSGNAEDAPAGSSSKIGAV